MNRLNRPSDRRGPLKRPRQSIAIPGVDALSTSGPEASRAATIAATVIQRSSRDSPADQVLRAELKKARGLDPSVADLTARMVFAYYRWRGWLEPEGPIEPLLTRALELQAEFNRDPAAWPDADLMARAVPDWTRNTMEVSPAWARSLQTEPTLWLRTRPGLAESVARQLPGATPGPIPDALEYRGTEDLFVHPEFQAGHFEIQDLSSQFVGHLCAPQPGETWWDACAGEGGKTMHLSVLMQNKGLIWASDRADWRLQRLKRRAARAQVFNYRAASWDGSERLPTKTQFDGVLVDAPCSGLGTWQKNPHARWTIKPADIEELAAVQTTLLARVAARVKPGGRLIYSVCTLARAETTDVVADFSGNHTNFVLERPSCPLLPSVSGTGSEVWLWPQDWRASGMFIAQWRRGS